MHAYNQISKIEFCRIGDVRLQVLRALCDLFHNTASSSDFLREVTENSSEVKNDLANISTQCDILPELAANVVFVEESIAPQMHNEDLAEADQSHLEVVDDEEGAVGGIILNVLAERSGSRNAGQVSNNSHRP